MSDEPAIEQKSDGMIRLALFTIATLFVGPLTDYGVGLVIQRPILYTFPVSAAVLIALSYAFGLWGSRFGLLVKIGAILWSVVIAWLSPIIMIYAFCYGGAILRIPDSCI